MANLYYRINIDEEKIDKNGNTTNIWTSDLPHHQKIAEFLPAEFNKLGVDCIFNGLEIAKHIESVTMKMTRNQWGDSIATIVVEPKPGFRWSKNRRQAVWDALDAQMSDGFGEAFDRHEIPGTEGHLIVF